MTETPAAAAGGSSLCAFYLLLVLGYAAAFVWALRSGKLGASLAIGPAVGGSAAWRRLLFWTSPVAVLGVWGAVSCTGWVDALWLPAPTAVFDAFWRLAGSGDLWRAIGMSAARIGIGFAAAAVIGVPLGLLAGAFTSVRTLVMPLNSFLRYIPPTAFVALLIIYCGVGETYKYAVIFVGTVFFIVSMVMDVVDDLDGRYVEMARVMGCRDGEIFRRFVLPATAPRVLDVLRINLSGAWIFLVVAEITGADGGLGHLIAISQRFLRTDELFVGIIAFGVIGLVTDLLIEQLSRRGFRWYYVSLKR